MTFLQYLSIGVCTLALVVGFAPAGALQAGALAGFGLLWALLEARKRRWIAHLGLFITTLAALVGLFSGVNFAWLLAALLAALAAWDLSSFAQRLALAAAPDTPAPPAETRPLIRQHLITLTITLLGGAALALFAGASALPLRLGAIAATLLALLAGAGAIQLLYWLRK